MGGGRSLLRGVTLALPGIARPLLSIAGLLLLAVPVHLGAAASVVIERATHTAARRLAHAALDVFVKQQLATDPADMCATKTGKRGITHRPGQRSGARGARDARQPPLLVDLLHSDRPLEK